MRVALLGVGLIGGSIGLAARRLAGAYVVGFDLDKGALARAVELGAIDEPAAELADAVAEADVVFVAAPVGASNELARQAIEAAGSRCAISDVGSTKREIVHAISDPRFVGGHPLAGAETAGVENARADLFAGATWYLTPAIGGASFTAGAQSPSVGPPSSSGGPPPPGEGSSPSALPISSPSALERLSGLIEQIGARPVTIDADEHDRLMASVSHLQHVFANVLVAQVSRSVGSLHGIATDDGTLGAGPSFRDATRVAGANTAIWTDIYMSNRDELIVAIDDAVARLGEVRTALERGDAGALSAWNEQARAERERLQRAGLTGGS